MDFAYLAKVTKLNVAALAAIASAPPPPEPKVEGAVSTDTAMSGRWCRARLEYVIRWRRTDAAMASCAGQSTACSRSDAVQHGRDDGLKCNAILPHIRVDDWVFGVSSVSKDGFESPVASAVPGGAFKPYVAPAKK